MRIVELVQARIEALSLTQDQVAMTWLERWNKQAEASGAKAMKGATPAPKLSKLLKGDLSGIKFFFDERARGAVLLDVLDVTGDGRQTYFDAADDALKTHGELPPKLIVDLASCGLTGEPFLKVCQTLESLLLVDPKVSPIAVVVTSEQHNHLPRLWDAHTQVHQVPDGETADLVRKLASDGALALSARHLVPLSHWLAADFHRDGRVHFDPSDGLDRFARDGRLPSAPAVEHLIDDVLTSPVAPLPVEQTGSALRRLILDLADESRAPTHGPARERQAYALALGIRATSTPVERREAALQQAAALVGVPLTSGTESDLTEALARAHRRPTDPVAYRIGDRIVTINCPGAPSDHPLIEAHTIEPSPPAITRLLDHIAAWTMAELLEDPFLLRATRALDPEGRDSMAFVHAAASVLHAGLAPVQSAEPMLDPWGQLSAVFADNPPEARLIIRNDDLNASRTQETKPRWQQPRVITQSQREALEPDSVQPWLRFGCPSTADALVGRDDSPSLITWNDTQNVWSQRRGQAATVLARAEDVRDPELWDDSLLASLGDSSAAQRLANECTRDRCGGFLRNRRLKPVAKPLTIPEGLWLETDRLVGLAWYALRQACKAGAGVQLHDGSALVPLSGAVFAQLTAWRRHPGQTSRLAALVTHLQTSYTATVTPVTQVAATHMIEGGFSGGMERGSYSISSPTGPLLPRELIVHGPGVAASIRFVPNVFGPAVSP